MAVTGAVTVSDSAVKPGNKVTCTVTLTNDSTVVSGISLRPVVTATGLTDPNVAAVASVPFVGASPCSVTNPFTITASTTSTFWFDVTFHSPKSDYGLAQDSSQVFDVGCIVTVLAADGSTRSMVTCDVANVTCAAPSQT